MFSEKLICSFRSIVTFDSFCEGEKLVIVGGVISSQVNSKMRGCS